MTPQSSSYRLESSCRPGVIEEFLLDRLSSEETQCLEEHLTQCNTCQSHFEKNLQDLELDASSSVWMLHSERLNPIRNINHSSLVQPTWDLESILDISKRLLPPSDNPAMIGKLGEFEILEPLGAGGMGIVYKGYDHELNRFVAVKVLSPSLSVSGAAKQRFLREAQAAAAVVHPHVVPIHAVSSLGQLPYLVMSYIPGENLQEYLSREGALPLGESLRIAHQVALGLFAAHQHGVIHRDVKPGNIMLERNVKRALLTDFGLARAADDASLTHSGLLAGTPNFMSPEQARGESIDARSDLFGLGSILYTMLAGHPPFRGEHAYVVLRRLVDDSPRSLTEIQPNLPPWIDRLIMKLLAKNREDRFQSAEEVASVLQACQLHVEHPSLHELPERLLLPLPRSALKSWGVMAIAATALILIIATSLWNRPQIAAQKDPTENHTSLDPLMNPTVSLGNDFEELHQVWLLEDRESELELEEIRASIEYLESPPSPETP